MTAAAFVLLGTVAISCNNSTDAAKEPAADTSKMAPAMDTTNKMKTDSSAMKPDSSKMKMDTAGTRPVKTT